MNYVIFLYFYAFAFTLLLSLLCTPLMKRCALRFSIVAYPHKQRLHQEPMPLLGGVAIVLSFYVTVFLHYGVLVCFPSVTEMLPSVCVPYVAGMLKRFPQFTVILLCGVLIFALGLLDDLKALGPKRKFLFEIFVGIILFYNDIRITIFFQSEFVSLFLTVFWVVAITNAFNLLDNIDGLSSGIAIISSFILFLLCVQGNQVLVAILLMMFIGALGGFLRSNYPPASIFMGDCGSLFIGYFISVLTIMSTFHFSDEWSLVPIVSPLLILAVPIYDTMSVIYIRIKNKKSIFTGDKNHFSHRLLRLGMSQKEAILFIYLVGLCLGIAALTLNNADLKSQLILLFQAGGLLSIIFLLERVKSS